MTDHLSIGEVLSLLQDEFPDVTISKIRFLESQGLIDPERTPSGYRKFYESDIERLRWILVQQREHFLPLKVIKDRLEDPSTSTVLEADPPPVTAAPTALADTPSVPEPEPASGPDGAAEPAEEPQPIWMADLARASAESKASAAAEAAQLPLGMDTGPSEVSLTAEELAQASGLSRDALRQLEQYGLVVGRSLGDDVFYDGDALLVATKAAGFLAHGVEPRHLRMFKVAAEREAGFLEQLAMPLLKQRNPAARRDAVALVEELSALGHDLRSVLLRANLRQHLDSH
ncbi:MAG: MerR family transcriptional regulator [Acidimicrobiales bacterium]|nr:MerR family transcriptional regulator [Acidimicrobiales bacterium]